MNGAGAAAAGVAGLVRSIVLRSGAAATLRAIRPDDRERLRAAFAALEPESVYLRYFSYKRELTEADLDRLCRPDFRHRVVLVVTLGADIPGAVIVGAGGYVVDDARPQPRRAEAAFAVEEDFQGQGISGRLLEALAEVARADAIGILDADVLARNVAMLRVFERSRLPMRMLPVEDGVLHVELALPPAAGAAPPTSAPAASR